LASSTHPVRLISPRHSDRGTWNEHDFDRYDNALKNIEQVSIRIDAARALLAAILRRTCSMVVNSLR
jgi:hypothetical protein